jgi:TolB-like protein
MPRRPAPAPRLAAALLPWLVLGAGAALSAETVALLPVQDRAGDAAAVRAVEDALGRGLAEGHGLVDRELLRDALRSRRIRSVDAAPPEELRALAAELGADRLVTAVVHLAEREVCPRLAVSVRSYDAATGEVSWAGFEAGSGLDGRRFLGLGVIEELEVLAAEVAGRILAGLAGPAGLDGGGASGVRPAAAAHAALAIVPLSGLAETDATRAAETVTEALRASLQDAGFRVLSPNRVADALHSISGRTRAFAWGALDVPVREALAEAGAELLLTGSVEAWETAGDGLEPEPVVAVALRAVDARTGRIVWTGALDRRGWDGQGLFRLGRIHDHGTLAARIVARLTAALAAAGPITEPSGEPSP